MQRLDDSAGRCVCAGRQDELGEQVAAEHALVESGHGEAHQASVLAAQCDPVDERGPVDHSGKRGFVAAGSGVGAFHVDVVHTADTTVNIL